MSVRNLPAAAPRGKEFAVAKFPHAIGASKTVVGAGRWSLLVDAEKAAKTLDARLSPFVILVEKAKP